MSKPQKEEKKEKAAKKREKLREKREAFLKVKQEYDAVKWIPLGTKRIRHEPKPDETVAERNARNVAKLAQLDKQRADEAWEKHIELAARLLNGSPVKVSNPFKKTRIDEVVEDFNKAAAEALPVPK